MHTVLASTLAKNLLTLSVAALFGFGLSWFLSRSADAVAATDNDEIITAWNRAVARLGINPVYPPTEDFYVGDLWAVLIEDQNADSDDRSQAALAKSVRLLHLQFPAEKFGTRWEASETKLADKDQSIAFRQDDILKPPEDSVRRMSTVSFPGLIINTKLNIRANSSLIGFDFSGDSQLYENIKISSALTYGVSAVDAKIELAKICAQNSPDTRSIYCTDRLARTILASSVTSRALDTMVMPDGQLRYKHAVQLRLISRVFLTRQIEQRRYTSRGEKLGLDALEGRGSGRAEMSRALDVGLNEIFRRPVVFGYRSVGLELPRSRPEPKTD